MTLLDRLVNVKISISSAVPDSTSFNYLLIVGAAPLQSPEEAPPKQKIFSWVSVHVEALAISPSFSSTMAMPYQPSTVSALARVVSISSGVEAVTLRTAI